MNYALSGISGGDGILNPNILYLQSGESLNER